MGQYQYPRVNKPASQQQPAVAQIPVSGADGNRVEPDNRPYSWVNSAREPEDGRFTQTNVPPLPQIPDHLNPALQLRQQPPPPPPAEPRSPDPVPAYTVDQKTDTGEYILQPLPQQHHYPEPAAREPSPNPSFHRSTPSTTAPEVVKHEYQPVLAQMQHQKPIYTVVPDVNPLTSKSAPAAATLIPFAAPPIRADTIPIVLPSHTQPSHGGSWHHSLGSCADTSTCVTSLFCPCVTYGKTQHRLAQRAAKADPTNMLGYSGPVNGACAAFAVLFCGCNFVLAAIQHTRVRKAYGIPGGVGDDCVRALCCCCCTLAQDEKEIKWREGGGEEAGLKRSGTVQYQAPLGMTYPGPPR